MKSYLTKEYAYRRRQVLFGGIVASVFGAAPLFCFVMPEVFGTDRHGGLPMEKILILSFITVIPGLLLSAGLWILHAWMTEKVNKLEISDAGVRYGSRFRRWDEIKRFSYHYIGNRQLTLFYQRKGFFGFDQNLMTTDPLTEDEVGELFEKLQQDVLPFHHQLRIG